MAVVTLRKKGYSVLHIAWKLNFSICTVQNILKKKADIGTVVDTARSGRPRATTQREDMSLIRLALSDLQASSKTLQRKLQDGTECSIYKHKKC